MVDKYKLTVQLKICTISDQLCNWFIQLIIDIYLVCPSEWWIKLKVFVIIHVENFLCEYLEKNITFDKTAEHVLKKLMGEHILQSIGGGGGGGIIWLAPRLCLFFLFSFQHLKTLRWNMSMPCDIDTYFIFIYLNCENEKEL